MAQINPAPLFMRDVLITIGTDSYEKQVSSVAFTPSASVVSWKGLTPGAVYSASTSATWTCDITFVQDWETTGSLSRYLFEHEGDEVTATFEPIEGGTTFTATIIITPGAIGGAVDTHAEATVSLGVKGKPVLAP